MPQEREYVVLTPYDDEAGDVSAQHGTGLYKLLTRGLFTSRQGALEYAYEQLGSAPTDDGMRTLIAIPSSYFKPVVVKVETVRQVKWEDG